MPKWLKAPVLGRENGLDEIVGQFLEGDRIVVLDAALADLGAVSILKVTARSPRFSQSSSDVS